MQGEATRLRAADGHEFDASLFAPDTGSRGGLVMLHEIFGLTGQMQRCAARYAAAGYRVVLPAMFDRREPGLVLGYDEFEKGGRTAMSIPEELLLADMQAAIDCAAEAGRVAALGFCWGGTLAYLAACRLPVAAAVSWYGGGIARLLGRMQPRVPVQYHFGAEDRFIPPAVIEQIRAVDPAGEIHVYPGAGHGFGCDDRDGYVAEAAALAEQRSLDFLARHLQAD